MIYMKKHIVLLLLSCFSLFPALAQNRHQIRVGWGDMLFESLVFREASPVFGGKGFTGHIFTEYQYSVSKVVSVGGQIPNMPTVRFTYLHSPWVELYSGLGAGLLCAFDNKGGAEFAPAVNLNLFGVQVGKGPVSASVELGALNSLVKSRVYMLGSRLVSVSLNYRF